MQGLVYIVMLGKKILPTDRNFPLPFDAKLEIHVL